MPQCLKYTHKIMKRILYTILAMIMILPMLAVFNGNFETIWVNLIAMVYGYMLWALTKYTKVGKRVFLTIYKNLI